MGDDIALMDRKTGPSKPNLPEVWKTDMTKTKTFPIASIYRLAEIAGLAFMLSALPVAAVSFIAQSA